MTSYPVQTPLDSAEATVETPFAETTVQTEQPAAPAGFLPWTESITPFEEKPDDASLTRPMDAAFAEAFTTLRDESFDEALADLVAETEEAVDERFERERMGTYGTERERLAELHLAPLSLEAEQYLNAVSEMVARTDVESLQQEQLDHLIEEVESEAGGLSPASDQFLKAIKSKVRRVAKVVKSVAGKVGAAAKGVLSFALKKLKGLIRPLLKRVLSFAINRLPAALQAPARGLLQKIQFEAEAEYQVTDEGTPVSATASTDPEMLAESFDAALAEALATERPPEGFEFERFSEQEDEQPYEGRELEALAEARSELIARLQNAQEGEDLAPAIENFVPALLPALRLGIRVVGRQRVVGFLSKYLAKLIGRWVGPQLSAPLSSAIVDVGLRLLTLEQPTEAEESSEAAPAVLAATIEDTIRRLTEHEEYIFENEDLTQLAVAEAFEFAVATNFPARFVRPALQQAPSLGGSFVPRGIRSARPYRKYSRIPTVEISAQVADGVRTFGGTTLGAFLRAQGVPLPAKVRIHVFEAVTGTTLPKVARNDRALARVGKGRTAWSLLHPLTPQAAGLLLREPRLGTSVPGIYLRSRQRIAVGQRFYYLEPLQPGSAMPARAGGNLRPTEARIVIDLRLSQITTAVYLSEAETQQVAAAIQQGRGIPVLLQTVGKVIQALKFTPGDRSVVIRHEYEKGEELAAALVARIAPQALTAVRGKIHAWFMTMVAEWVKARMTEFTRAAADPADGVTLRLTMRAVPGLPVLGAALSGKLTPETMAKLLSGDAFKGTPSGTISLVPGRQWP
jgi:hypothetical protein